MSESRSVQLKRRLEQEIIEGLLRPGQRLDEIALAKRFNVSRTPIREALRELSTTGLVELRPQRGCFVSGVSVQNLLEIFEVMAELEAMCARLAARRMTDTECQQLAAIHHSSEAAVGAVDLENYYTINLELHDAIYRGSHNQLLYEQTTGLARRLAPYRRMQLRRANRLQDSFAEHGRVMDAIVKRDADQAEALMRAHITVQPDALHDFIAQLTTGQLQTAS